MSKTEKYFKNIQEICKKNIGEFDNYIKEIDEFLKNQELLKRNKIKTLSDKVKIYFIEYINIDLENDYYNNNKKRVDIFTFLYYKISEVCLKLKSVAVDDILISCMLSKKDKINSIIVDNYYKKQKEIKELEEEIKELKKGMI